MATGDALFARNLEPVIAGLLTEEPVLVLNGPRSVGKSTLLRRCADAHNVSVIDLDDRVTRLAVAADPAYYVTGKEPVCIDEFQHVLEVLDAVKAQLNRDLRPGRYLITGSTRYATLPATSQSLTGRAHIVNVWPLSQGELRGRRERFLDTLLADPSLLLEGGSSTTTRDEYEHAILRGGFPIALARRTDRARERWFRTYVNMVVTRDVLEIRKVRQRSLLPRVLRRLAAQTAQVLNAAQVAVDLDLNKALVGDYIGLLEAAFLVHRLEAHGRTLTASVRRSPKVHLVDSGLAAHFLGVTQAGLAARDPAALTELGHLAETFVVNEVLKQISWSDAAIDISHFRTKHDQEVDLVCEAHDGRVAGVEVKAASSANARDFAGLRLLRDRLGKEFVGGVVLHLGPYAYRFDEKLYAVPLDRLWR